MVVLLLLILTLTLLFLYVLLAPQKHKIPSSIPAPPAIPFFKHALLFPSTSSKKQFLYLHPLKQGKNLGVLHVFMDCMKKYGGVFQLQIGPTPPLLVFSNPKSVEHILGSTKHLDKALDYRFFHSWLGTGLLTSSGAKWKKHRRIITPTFHFKILEDFIHVFNATGDVLIESLRRECGKETFDIVPFFSLFALDAICGITISLFLF